MSAPPRVWSAGAQALFELSGHTAVEAGAGSGKTSCLVELALRLLSGEATGTPLEPSAIAAITFTERAAEELAERLRGAVAGRLREAPSSGAEARAWGERLAAIDRLFAGTIHAFAGGLLREHALEAGLDPAFAVLDEWQAEALRLEAARDAVVAALDGGRAGTADLAALLGAGGGRAGLAELLVGLLQDRASRGQTATLAPAPDRGGEALLARERLRRAAGALLLARPRVRTATMRAAHGAFAEAWAALRPGDLDGPVAGPARARLLAAAAALRGGKQPDLAELRQAVDEAAEAFGELAAEALARPQAEELARLAGEAEARYREAKRRQQALDFDDLLLRARDLLASEPGLLAELRGRLRVLLVDEVQDVNPVQQEIADLLCGAPSPARPGPAATLVAVGDTRQSIYRFRGADVAVFRGLLDRLAAGQGRVLRLSDNHRSTPGVLEVVNAVSARALQPLDGAPRPWEIAFGEGDRLRAVRQPGLAPACELLEDGGSGGAAERRAREAEAIAARIGALLTGRAGLALPGGRVPGPGDVAVLFRRLTQVGEYERALRRAGIPYRLARGGGFYQAAEVRDLGELLACLFDPQDELAWAAALRSPLCGIGDGALCLLGQGGLARLARVDPGEEGRGLARRMGEIASSPPLTPALSPRFASLRGGRGSGASEAETLSGQGEGIPAVADPFPLLRASGGEGQGEGGFDPAAAWTPSFIQAESERLARFLSTWRELFARRGRLPVGELLAEAVERLDLEAVLLAAPDGERRRDNLRKALALARRHAAAGGSGRGLAERLRHAASRPPREPEAAPVGGGAVTVLTIHQAKGLEWPVVFVPDLGAPGRRDQHRVALDGEGRLCAAWIDPDTEESVTTASLAAARAEDGRAATAESRRLLYVALTRARDLLVLSGDASTRGESWRKLVEEGLAPRPDLLRRVPFAAAGSAAAGPPLAPERAAAQVATGPERPPRLPQPARLAAVRAAVTDLAEAARCPTRHFLSRRLQLAERPGGSGPAGEEPERATARGTLAHALLAGIDLSAPPLERRAQLLAGAARFGQDPAARSTGRILADVTRFLDTPRGRWLAERQRAGALARELPFQLRLDGGAGPACYLTGAIDALVEERKELLVLDYKYALPRREAAERYRLQLCAYALVAARARPGLQVRAEIQFLRGRCESLDLTPTPAALRDLERQAPALAAALHAGGAERPPAELGRTRERCLREGCGFVYRCYRSPRP